MPITLTSQEKKVLGFIAVMVALGIVMLAARHFHTPAPSDDDGVAVATPAAVDKTHE